MAAELLPIPSARAIPSSIGRYDVVALLGEGGMARVFLALQRGAFAAEKLVVIKQVRPEFAADSDFLAMFVDEARIALQLNHPNVVHTYEVVGEYPDYFLTMEFLEGRTLAQTLRKHGRQSFPVDLHIWILVQVLSGLQYAHELKDLDGTPLGIVHRDVNPSNVLVTSSGEVRLLDFGIAKAAGAISFTQRGVVKGKLGYAAPEQCLARVSDARADIFAVGMMLWEAIAGQRRSPAESSAAALQARVTGKERDLEQVVADVPPRLAEACRRALAQKPEERYSSAAELKADLEEYLDEQKLRPNASHLAELMGSLFGKEFAELRGLIESRVQEGRRASQRYVHEPSSFSRASHLSSIPQLAVEPTSAPRARKRVLIGLAAGSALAAVALATVLTPGKGPDRLEASSPPAAAPPSPLPISAQPSASVAPAPSVRLAIAATPKRAQISLDGQLLPNPFVGMIPRDDRDHELEVMARGFDTQRHVLRFSQDLALTVELDPETARARPYVARVRPTPTTSPAQLPSGTAQGNPTTARSATGQTPALHPGQDLTKAPRTLRSLDEKDPYR